MNDAFSYKSKETIAYLSEYFYTIFLSQLLSWFNKFLQVALAKLLYNVVVIFTLHNINKTHDIWVLKCLHNFDLLKKGFY